MPRFLVERTLPRRPAHSHRPRRAPRSACSVGRHQRESGVTWVHSYVTGDLRKTFCIYDAPTPEAIRETPCNNNLPIDSITPVSVLDPYFYRG